MYLSQQYYTQIEQIDELKRSITFPKLESPPADFLHQMEAYVKEAPRPMDEAMMSGGAYAGKKVRPLEMERGIRCFCMLGDLCWTILHV